MKLNFTKRSLDALTIPEAGQRTEYQDARVPGLVLRHSSHDVKSFSVLRRVKHGKLSRVTLGRYPDMSIEQARQRASRVISELTHGVDVNAERKASHRQQVTLRDIFEAYVTTKELRTKTLIGYRAVLRLAFTDWLDTDMASLTKDRILARHQQLGARSPSLANSAMRLLRALFNYAKLVCEDANGQTLFPDNPVSLLSHTRAWYKVKPRQTLIKSHQLKAWFEAVTALGEDTAKQRSGTTRDYLLFLLLTGLRQSEAANLRWSDIDLKDETMTIAETKNDQTHTLPLSTYLIEMLTRRFADRHTESPYVFPSRNVMTPIHDVRKQLARVISASGVSFTLHDLRRTFITIAESLDMSAYTLKRLLNHKVQQDVTAGYIVLDVERLRDPMERITQHILSLCCADG